MRRAVKWGLILVILGVFGMPLNGIKAMSPGLKTMIETAIKDQVVAPPNSTIQVTWDALDLYPEFEPTGVRVIAQHPIYAAVTTRASLAIYGREGAYTVVPVDIMAVAKTQVFMTQKNLQAGHIIQASDIRAVMRDMNATPSHAVSDEAAIIGKKLSGRLRSNQCITSTLLQEPDWIVAGESVQVVIESDMIRVKKVGVARSSGTIGDIITLDVGTDQWLNGEVVDDKTVRIR